MAGTLLAVDAYISRFVEGSPVGAFGPINLQSLSVTQPEPETIQRVSRMRSSYGQALDSVSRPQPTELSFVTDETAPDVLSMAMLGQPATYAQTSGTDVAGTFTAKHDRWVAIGKNNLSAFAIATKDLGVDYEIVMDAGLVKVLSTGTITDASTVNYTASYPAREGEDIVFGTDSVLQVQITGIGVNQATGQRMDFEIYQANVSPSGGLELIGDEFLTLEFAGNLVTPEGKTGPFMIRRHRTAT